MECREKSKLILSLWGFKAGVEAEATDWEDCRLSLVCFSTEERKIAWRKASWTEHSICSYCGALRGGPLFFLFWSGMGVGMSKVGGVWDSSGDRGLILCCCRSAAAPRDVCVQGLGVAPLCISLAISVEQWATEYSVGGWQGWECGSKNQLA